MLRTGSSGGMEEHISIEASSIDLRLLLDMMNPSRTARALYDAQYIRLLELADKYDCFFVTDRLLLRLHEHIKEQPWTMFVIAAKHDQPTMAKVALGEMSQDHLAPTRFATLATSAVQGMPPAYLLGLERAMAKPTRNNSTSDYWEQVASHFSRAP